MSRLWLLPSQVGKRLGSFSWKNRWQLELVSRSTHILLLGQLLKGICGVFEDKFSVAGSIIATKAVTPRSSDGSTIYMFIGTFRGGSFNWTGNFVN